MLTYLKAIVLCSSVVFLQSCQSHAQTKEISSYEEQAFSLADLTYQSRAGATDSFKSLRFPIWVEGCLQAGGKNYGANPFLFARATQEHNAAYEKMVKAYNASGQDDEILRDFIQRGGQGWKLSLMFDESIAKVETIVPLKQPNTFRFRYKYYDSHSNIWRSDGDCGLFLVELAAIDFGELYSISSVATVSVMEFSE